MKTLFPQICLLAKIQVTLKNPLADGSMIRMEISLPSVKAFVVYANSLICFTTIPIWGLPPAKHLVIWLRAPHTVSNSVLYSTLLTRFRRRSYSIQLPLISMCMLTNLPENTYRFDNELEDYKTVRFQLD